MTKTKMYAVKPPRKNAAVATNNITKRKRVVLNFIQREELIGKYKSGFSVEKLALDYDISRSTVFQTIKTGSERLVKYRLDNPDSEMKSVFKGSKYPDVDAALKIWFYQARADNVTINSSIVAEQALLFYEQFYPIAPATSSIVITPILPTPAKSPIVITPIATTITAQEPTTSNSSDAQKRFVGSRGFVDKFCARYAI